MNTGDQGWHRSSGEERTLKSQLARDWAQAVASIAYRPTTRAEIELYLRGHLETLHDALLAQPFSPEPGREIGASLVRIHLTKPETVEETLVLLADRLLTDLGLDTYTFQHQLNRLLGALAQGFTRALRDRALSDLEQVWAAALRVNVGSPLEPLAPPEHASPVRPVGPPEPAEAGSTGAEGTQEPAHPVGPVDLSAPIRLVGPATSGGVDGPAGTDPSAPLGPPGTIGPAEPA